MALSDSFTSFAERGLNTKETKKLNKELEAINAKKMFLKKFLIGWIAVAVIVGVIAFVNLHKVELYYLLIVCVFIYNMIGCWVYMNSEKPLVLKNMN